MKFNPFKICQVGIKPMMALVFGMLFCASVAQAQTKPVSEDLLALDHRSCMAGCVPGFGEQTCKALCDCTAGEFRKELTFESHLDLRAKLSRNELTPALRAFLDKVANYCTAELDRQGIQVGQGVPTQDPEKPGSP